MRGARWPEGAGRRYHGGMERVEGFVVHAWTEYRSGRVLLAARLVDGRSAAAAFDRWLPWLQVPEGATAHALELAREGGFRVAPEPGPLAAPRGEALATLRMADRERKAFAERLSRAGVPNWGAADRAADQFLLEKGIRAGVRFEGEARPGRRVALVFPDPILAPSDTGEAAALRWLSLDIETTREGRVSACGLVQGEERTVFVVAPGPVDGAEAVEDERALLLAIRDRIVELDPDVITGWNVVDFDLRVLGERAAALGLPFDAGRTEAPLRIVESPGQRTLAVIEGRRCVDAMKVLRSAPERFEDQRLETVARGVLGEGKLVSSSGPEKLDELEALRVGDPARYAAYCLRDAELPLAILEKTGMGALTVLRSSLTGLELERAWTSVPAFERVYARALGERGIAAAPPEPPEVGNAAGGLILEPRPGLFEGVVVFDFRSLYPSIIRTFNVDPVARLRASGGPDDLVAPNGARFSRERGVLPEIVDGWTALRAKALEAGDEARAYVLKILQNSFYGVLGTPSCVWAHDELAGAITGYGHEILKATRDWFRERGYEVLYGDTDSVFVRFGAEAARDPAALRALAGELAAEAVGNLSGMVSGRWGVVSRLDLRFDKLYARFLIPRIRGDRAARVREELERAGSLDLLDGAPSPRGRAKGYAGLLVASDGTTKVDVKGLEAARGDWTPLARRFQVELLALAFDASGEAEAKDYARNLAAELRSGRLDGELAFRRTLRRDLELYAADSPHVKAARLSGASARGDTVEYVQTLAGPEPVGALSSGIDHQWYLERQLAPIWESIAEAAGWEPDLVRLAGQQGELF